MLPAFDFKDMRERWARFQAWENQRLSSDQRPLAARIQWLNDAREMAAGFDPDWGSRARAEAHWRELARCQQVLSRVQFEK